MIVRSGSWESWAPVDRETSVTIGVLDGVHLGHQRLLSRLDSDLMMTVLTFDPHPIEVLRPGTPPRLITTVEERIERFAALGVDCVGVLDLAEIREQSPETFVSHVLVDRFRVGQLVVGEDFRFGHDRSGDVSLLRTLSHSHDFALDIVELVTDGGDVVSSSRIRALVEAGKVDEAAELLGTWFSLTGEVTHGDKRGRELGFPTANLKPPRRKLIPANGVYACLADVDGETHWAAVNVGVRPTFGGDELLVEAFLLGFDSEIYGKEITVRFVEHLRPELEFSSVDALVDQMAADVEETREILTNLPAVAG
ncbi:MAG TPA: bifunctional riboflavin kinase/FAD synthetase [Acidimicrobiia bacterium]|nr:bifunctional riboflavin kinase/FAD synthetase [Acidimicrobiia bacterium]